MDTADLANLLTLFSHRMSNFRFATAYLTIYRVNQNRTLSCQDGRGCDFDTTVNILLWEHYDL